MLRDLAAGFLSATCSSRGWGGQGERIFISWFRQQVTWSQDTHVGSLLNSKSVCQGGKGSRKVIDCCFKAYLFCKVALWLECFPLPLGDMDSRSNMKTNLRTCTSKFDLRAKYESLSARPFIDILGSMSKKCSRSHENVPVLNPSDCGYLFHLNKLTLVSPAIATLPLVGQQQISITLNWVGISRARNAFAAFSASWLCFRECPATYVRTGSSRLALNQLKYAREWVDALRRDLRLSVFLSIVTTHFALSLQIKFTGLEMVGNWQNRGKFGSSSE